MIELHIYLLAQAGREADLEKVYKEAYVPAISVQDGFISTALIKKSTAIRQYEIDIAFETEEKRLAWVASKEHQEAWPKIEALCSDISWQGFEVVA